MKNSTKCNIPKVKPQINVDITQYSQYNKMIVNDMLFQYAYIKTQDWSDTLDDLNPCWGKNIEDIYFFEMNTKYISSSELKTSEFS